MLTRILAVVAVVGIGLGVSACGKTLNQLKQTAHDLIEIAGSAYTDLKENMDTAKQTVKDTVDAVKGAVEEKPAE